MVGSNMSQQKIPAPEQAENAYGSRARRVILWAAASVLIVLCAYVGWARTGIRHEEYSFYDATRGRNIDVDIAIRRDLVSGGDGGGTIPVAIINHGNTVRYTEYSFISNLLATKGYMAVSIQHDLASDAPLVTQPGEPFVGREPVYVRGDENIEYVLHRLSRIQPNADLHHLIMIGHSNGGDIAMYFAAHHPSLVKDVVTLDNLRVPLEGPFKILSIRSRDPNFVADGGVVPSDEICEKTGTVIVRTDYRHTDMSDRGPETVRDTIMHAMSKFLDSTGKRGTSSSTFTKISALLKIPGQKLAAWF